MTIRKCPACAQLIHFQAEAEIETCWNCGRTAVRAHLKLFEQRLVERAVRFFDDAAEFNFGPPAYHRRIRIALLVMLPVAIYMLIMSNSLDINGHTSLIYAYGSDRIPMPHLTCEGLSW